MIVESQQLTTACSPAAGGFFSGNRESSKRWQKGVSYSPRTLPKIKQKKSTNSFAQDFVGDLYSSMYEKPAILDAVDRVFDVAAKHNITTHAAALRWVAFHSQLDGKYGDGVVFSTSKLAQLNQNLDAFEAGPLPTELAETLSAVYNSVKGEEPFWHF
jgi:aflatoxin B1 aldehyde reductase